MKYIKSIKDISIAYGGLGDIWRSLSYINCHYVNRPINLVIENKAVDNRLNRINEFLKNTKHSLRINDIKFEESIDDLKKHIFVNPIRLENEFQYTDVLTQYKGIDKKVCIHLDGHSWKGKKGIKKSDRKILLEEVLHDYDVEYLTGKMDIKRNIEIMSTCKYFIGVDSGFSHICHSIKLINCFILKGKMPDRIINGYHSQTKYTLIKNVKDIIL